MNSVIHPPKKPDRIPPKTKNPTGLSLITAIMEYDKCTQDLSNQSQDQCNLPAPRVTKTSVNGGYKYGKDLKTNDFINKPM